MRGFIKLRNPLSRCQIGDVHNQRIETGATFGSIDPGDRLTVRRISSQTIHRLGRHGDALALRDQPRGFSHCVGAKGQSARFKGGGGGHG